jgi:integrase
MANIRKVERKGSGSRPRYAWEVRYRDPQRKDRSKTFRTKVEAEDFADAVETDMSRGHYLDPRLGKKTLGEWAEEWLQARETEIKPTTFMSYKGLLDVHLLPAFGQTSMSRIRPLDVQKLFARMAEAGLSRSRLRQARQLLSMILNAAVDNGYIGRNPVPRERLRGKEPRRDQHPLTFKQVHAVADAVPIDTGL